MGLADTHPVAAPSICLGAGVWPPWTPSQQPILSPYTSSTPAPPCTTPQRQPEVVTNTAPQASPASPSPDRPGATLNSHASSMHSSAYFMWVWRLACECGPGAGVVPWLWGVWGCQHKGRLKHSLPKQATAAATDTLTTPAAQTMPCLALPLPRSRLVGEVCSHSSWFICSYIYSFTCLYFITRGSTRAKELKFKSLKGAASSTLSSISIHIALP